MITYEEKELLKDDVLKYLQTTNGVYSPQIAEKLKQKIELIDYLIYQLKLDGYVYTHSLNEHIIYIHDRGRFFLNIDGGHEFLIKEKRREERNNTLKTTAIIINAVAIIGIAIIGLYLQYCSNKKEDKIDKLENEISVLKQENLVLTNSKSSPINK